MNDDTIKYIRGRIDSTCAIVFNTLYLSQDEAVRQSIVDVYQELKESVDTARKESDQEDHYLKGCSETLELLLNMLSTNKHETEMKVADGP